MVLTKGSPTHLTQEGSGEDVTWTVPQRTPGSVLHKVALPRGVGGLSEYLGSTWSELRKGLLSKTNG